MYYKEYMEYMEYKEFIKKYNDNIVNYVLEVTGVG